MDSFINFFNIIFYKPLFNVLILLYEYLPWHDLGIAVILLTVLIRILLYPLGAKAIKSQKIMQELQPKLKEIKEKYKGDSEKQTKATIELYQKEKINLFSGCLPLLIQFPILLALYWVFTTFEGGLAPEELRNLYSFVPSPEVGTKFLGTIDLIQPSVLLAVFAGISQFFQTKMSGFSPIKTQKGKGDMSQMMQKQMVYFLPLFTLFILYKLPAVIGLYWLTTTLFSIAQQYFIFKTYQPKLT